MTDSLTGMDLEQKTGGDASDASAPQKSDADSGGAKKPKKKYTIAIFKDWCKCCGICAAFCPRECIRINEEGAPVVDEADRCTGCGWCELHCPDFAISVRQQKESGRDRSEAD
jgi:2-oxoglutarate ferredoxin oxidoreductase subunit delta